MSSAIDEHGSEQFKIAIDADNDRPEVVMLSTKLPSEGGSKLAHSRLIALGVSASRLSLMGWDVVLCGSDVLAPGRMLPHCDAILNLVLCAPISSCGRLQCR